MAQGPTRVRACGYRAQGLAGASVRARGHIQAPQGEGPWGAAGRRQSDAGSGARYERARPRERAAHTKRGARGRSAWPRAKWQRRRRSGEAQPSAGSAVVWPEAGSRWPASRGRREEARAYARSSRRGRGRGGRERNLGRRLLAAPSSAGSRARARVEARRAPWCAPAHARAMRGSAAVAHGRRGARGEGERGGA